MRTIMTRSKVSYSDYTMKIYTEVPTIPHFAELSCIYTVYSAIPFCDWKIPLRHNKFWRKKIVT